mmetsp:Transcript_2904/g.9081  ORF Transcript_2904/g.9081 Transcript_2904/m.9081 type:complete len:216 (+) Transcript_2904:456-1103(+)
MARIGATPVPGPTRRKGGRMGRVKKEPGVRSAMVARSPGFRAASQDEQAPRSFLPRGVSSSTTATQSSMRVVRAVSLGGPFWSVGGEAIEKARGWSRGHSRSSRPSGGATESKSSNTSTRERRSCTAYSSKRPRPSGVARCSSFSRCSLSLAYKPRRPSASCSGGRVKSSSRRHSSPNRTRRPLISRTSSRRTGLARRAMRSMRSTTASSFSCLA